MDDGGIIESSEKLFEIPSVFDHRKENYIYQVSDAKNLL